jgi:membrane-bound lytic murein transglycosylase D
VGYWQFIRGTGKRYGLEISKVVDERRDPVLATQAAAEYFKGLYGMFGSWYLAMASYNVGENRVKKEVNKHETRDFWELSRKSRLPAETLNYIPKFIAAKMIGKDPEKYGFTEIDYLNPIEFETLTLEKPMNLRVMAEKLNMNYEDFKALNPKFKGEIAPLKDGKALILRVPVGQQEAALQAAAESVAESVEFIADIDTQSYKVRRGDNLPAIARRFRTSVAYLRDLNDIPRKKALKVGSIIYVPDRRPLNERNDRTAKTKIVAKSAVAAPSTWQKNDGRFHIVRNGDNLTTIARKYNTTVQQIYKVNNIARGRTLRIGTKLRLPVTGQQEDQSVDTGINPPDATQMKRNVKVHIVKKGESLGHIAEAYKVDLSALKKRNKIRNPSSLMAGVKLIIPVANAKE